MSENGYLATPAMQASVSALLVQIRIARNKAGLATATGSDGIEELINDATSAVRISLGLPPYKQGSLTIF